MLLLASLLAFVAISILTRYLRNQLLTLLYKAAAIWIGFAIYIFFASLIPRITVPLILIAVIAQLYGLYHATRTKVVRHEVEIVNLPTYWQGKKIAFVADLHIGLIYGPRSIHKLAAMLKQKKPELILIGGDLYDGPDVDTSPITQALKELRAHQDVLYVTGNHEQYGPKQKFLDSIADAGITVLDDTQVTKEGLNIIGLGYATSLDAASTAATLQKLKIPSQTPSLLIKHVPTDLAPIAKAGVSLALFGHTHQGQMFPWNLLTRWIYKGYDHGLKKFGDTAMITTSGFGSWGPPQRIGTDSEIVIVTLNKK